MGTYNDEIQLKDILVGLLEYKAFLVKKKMVIIAFSFLFLILGVVYATFMSPVKYNAKLTFVVDAESTLANVGSMGGLASQFGFDLGGSNDIFSQNNVIELLRTRGVVEKVLMQGAKINDKYDILINHYIAVSYTHLTLPTILLV